MKNKIFLENRVIGGIEFRVCYYKDRNFDQGDYPFVGDSSISYFSDDDEFSTVSFDFDHTKLTGDEMIICTHLFAKAQHYDEQMMTAIRCDAIKVYKNRKEQELQDFVFAWAQGFARKHSDVEFVEDEVDVHIPVKCYIKDAFCRIYGVVDTTARLYASVEEHSDYDLWRVSCNNLELSFNDKGEETHIATIDKMYYVFTNNVIIDPYLVLNIWKD